MKRQPKISVILPIYNAGKFLPKAVDSVRNQTFSNFECLLCDASTDGSSDFLDDLCLTDERFILLRQEKTSLANALQHGIEAARAELIVRMDADDISLPNRFSVQLATMMKRPDLIVLGSAIQYIDENGFLGLVSTMPRNKSIRHELLWGCPFSHPSVIFRRSYALQAGGYRSFCIGSEDYDLWLRMSKLGELDNIPNILLLYRMHGQNSVLINARTTRKFSIVAQTLHIIDEKCAGDMSTTDLTTILEYLSPLQRVRVLARMLCCSAHLIGDTEEDPEGAAWIEEIQRALPDPELEKALAIYHMRCAKRYAQKNPYKALKHILDACRINIGVVVSMGKKIVKQHVCRFFQLLKA